MKKLLKQGAVSLSGAVSATLSTLELQTDNGEYQSLSSDNKYPSPAARKYLKEILQDAFYTYDTDGNGKLDRNEVFVFFRDFHESINEEACYELFDRYDVDKSGYITLDEFIAIAYSLIKAQESQQFAGLDESVRDAQQAMAQQALNNDEDGQEEEEVPEEFTNLPPDQQQTAIKRRAFVMLAIGTFMVVLFSEYVKWGGGHKCCAPSVFFSPCPLYPLPTAQWWM